MVYYGHVTNIPLEQVETGVNKGSLGFSIAGTAKWFACGRFY
jgi:hypothetical protein